MSWIDDEVARRNKENAERAKAVSEETKRREASENALSSAWKQLIAALQGSVERFNAQSQRKAAVRVTGPELSVHWQGKGPLLNIRLDREKYAIVYTYLSEAPCKFKVVLNDHSDPSLWMEGRGQLSFEAAAEFLLKPVLFP